MPRVRKPGWRGNWYSAHAQNIATNHLSNAHAGYGMPAGSLSYWPGSAYKGHIERSAGKGYVVMNGEMVTGHARTLAEARELLTS